MFGENSEHSDHRRFKSDHKRHYDMLFKVVLTGDANVGKTRIIQHYIYGSSSDNQKPTIGV